MGDATAPPAPAVGFKPPPGTWEQVLALPWVIQVLAVVFILLVIGSAFPKVLGPFQEAAEQWTDSRRRTKAAGKDADVTALREQVDEMQTVLAESRQETAATRRELREFREETRVYQRRHDEVLGVHARWDRAMIQLVASLGGTPLPQPPLWPETTRRPPAGDGGWTADIDHP